MKTEHWQLKQRQGLPLSIKEKYTENRIRMWYEHWHRKVYVSFSGGLDSTVLLHQVRRLYPKVQAVFADTGLEYPEIRQFVKTINNVVWLKPIISFKEVLKKYGYPVISKETARKLRDLQNPTDNNKRTIAIRMGKAGSKVGHCPKKWLFLKDAPFKISDQCCNVMKKQPFAKYEKESGKVPYIGSMVDESRYRRNEYLRLGCNIFSYKRPQSRPLSFWTKKDVWKYIEKYNIVYSEIYNMGYERTGCMFCAFGAHLDKGENRFQRMKRTHLKQWEYCMAKLGIGRVLDFIGVSYNQNTIFEI